MACIRKVRIDQACRMLSGYSGSLSEIALSCRFFDASHFGMVFKKQTGLSPKKWQKMIDEQNRTEELPAAPAG